MMKKLIVLILLLGCAQGASAACSNTAYGNGGTCVQFKECEVLATATSIPCTFTSNVTAGSLILAFCRIGANHAITSISDNINAGSYTKAWEQDDATNGKVLANYFLPNSSSGAITVTCHWATTNTNNALDIVELGGMATASPLDQQNSAVFTASSAPSSGNITTVNANDVIWGAFSFQFSSTTTVSTENNSFTQEMNDTLGTASHVHLHGADRGVSSTLTVAYAPTLSATDTGQIGVAAYQVAAAGGTSPGINKRIKLEQFDNLTAVLSGGGFEVTANEIGLGTGPCATTDATCSESLEVCFADGTCHSIVPGDKPATVSIVKNWSPSGVAQTAVVPILSMIALSSAAVP